MSMTPPPVQTDAASVPIWQQSIVILFALMTVFLIAWYAIHGTVIPDWLAGVAGVYVGFISHALGVKAGQRL